MRRITIATLTGVTALTLGTIAGASTTATQDVTISVVVAPMTVSVVGVDPSFTIVGGATGIDESNTATSLSFSNPASQPGVARIDVQRTVDPILGDLVLSVRLEPAGDGESYTAASGGNTPSWTVDQNDTRGLAINIATGTDITGRQLTWTLAGTAPSDPTTITSDFTYTIAQG